MQKDIYDPTKPFNEQIRKLIRDTHPQYGPIVLQPHGKRFRVSRNQDYWRDYEELTGTDGIGTKGLLHWRMGTIPSGVQDVFAMVMDDLMEGGYIPVILQDHILMEEEDETRIFAATRRLRDLCVENPWVVDGERTSPIIISGGETAIINTLQGFEMEITATGYVRRGDEILGGVRDGDVIIGLGSNGIHSNGLSFYRQELFDKRGMKIDGTSPWNNGVTIGEELTKPTHVYMPALKELLRQARERNVKPGDYIRGMVHITGGGLSKLKELLTPGVSVDINVRRGHPLVPQDVFQYAFSLGTPSEKMYTRFNNGVGYVVAVPRKYSEDALSILRRRFPAQVIGEVNKGSGKVLIESQYESKTVQF